MVLLIYGILSKQSNNTDIIQYYWRARLLDKNSHRGGGKGVLGLHHTSVTHSQEMGKQIVVCHTYSTYSVTKIHISNLNLKKNYTA